MVSREGWTYGLFEARAKLPCGRGTWPAIWMLPVALEDWPGDTSAGGAGQRCR
jgi:beta-glucanase (GH16 family)